jgi:hypothetical protein
MCAINERNNQQRQFRECELYDASPTLSTEEIAPASDVVSLFKHVRNIERIKARRVIDKERALAFLPDVFFFEKNIDHTIARVSARNIRGIYPALTPNSSIANGSNF